MHCGGSLCIIGGILAFPQCSGYTLLKECGCACVCVLRTTVPKIYPNEVVTFLPPCTQPTPRPLGKEKIYLLAPIGSPVSPTAFTLRSPIGGARRPSRWRTPPRPQSPPSGSGRYLRGQQQAVVHTAGFSVVNGKHATRWHRELRSRLIKRGEKKEKEIRGSTMLSWSTPCLWITFCLYLCCHVDSGEAQNAKEGKFPKFGLSSHPRRVGGKTSVKTRRFPQFTKGAPFVFIHISPLNTNADALTNIWMSLFIFFVLNPAPSDEAGMCGGWQRHVPGSVRRATSRGCYARQQTR